MSLLVACGPRIPAARTSDDALPTGREIDARRVYREADCAASTGLFFPGLGQICQKRYAEGAVLTTLAVSELSTGIAVAVDQEDLSHPGAALPLVGLQNLWLAGYADALFVEQRSRRMRFVPHDTLSELAIAPFNPRVLSQPDVWLGLIGALGTGLALSFALSDDTDTHLGDDANLFGHRFEPIVGYPLAGGVGAALFSHVAIGEEAFFRGMIQSEMARRTGETEGWVAASVAFGALHAPNALGLPSDSRRGYVLYGVPFLMAAGGYLGLVYRWHDYSLAPPVALHFWYDFLLSAVGFALDPDDSILSARFSVPL